MEAYVNQDYAPQREQQLPDIDEIGRIMSKYPAELGTAELIARIYFLDRKPPRDIANMLYVSVRYVNKCIAKYRKIIAENIKKNL